MPDELLTAKEVAELLKLNQQTVRNMIDRGEVGHVRVGQRRVRVRQSQLDAFLAAGEASAQPAEANPWQAVRGAASEVVAAVRVQDRDALDRAISTLADAAKEIPPGAVNRSA
jgi:excisionase family DNA binding protein